MKCVGAGGLVAQCNDYQLGGNEKAVLTCVCFLSYIPYGNTLFGQVVPHSWCVRVYVFLWLHSASIAI